MAANAVFLDTNGWIALLNASDTLHATADATWKSLGRPKSRKQKCESDFQISAFSFLLSAFLVSAFLISGLSFCFPLSTFRFWLFSVSAFQLFLL
jgi:hypothetical protein